jgi:hypothetical protein
MYNEGTKDTETRSSRYRAEEEREKSNEARERRSQGRRARISGGRLASMDEVILLRIGQGFLGQQQRALGQQGALAGTGRARLHTARGDTGDAASQRAALGLDGGMNCWARDALERTTHDVRSAATQMRPPRPGRG